MQKQPSKKNLPMRLLETVGETVMEAVNKATSTVESIRLLGELSRDVKSLRDEVKEIKSYLARQEEIARVMIEQGNFVEEEDLFGDEDDLEDKDKKDMN